MQMLIIDAVPDLSPWMVSVAALAGAGLLGWLSWMLVERPALGLKATTRRREASVAPMRGQDQGREVVSVAGDATATDRRAGA